MSRILIAEDDEAVRTFVSRALSLQGHEVTAVDDGDRALDALCRNAYDLLLTDIVMPGLDGIALARQAARRHPEMRILLMSGFSAERARGDGGTLLACRIVNKPFSLKEICAAVREALGDGRQRRQRG